LLGETSGYVIDANASKYILMKLLSIVDLDIDMGDLEKKATRIERYCQKH
jgi:proteasome assembly chaperone (PAC2) family protein